MTRACAEKFVRQFSNESSLDVALAPYSTFRCPASTDVMATPSTQESFVRMVEFLHAQEVRYGEAFRILGRGSNILVRDGGFRGVLIDLGSAFGSITLQREDQEVSRVRVEAGVANNTLLNWLKKRSLSGFEFSYGIPGTVGGGIRMNAGTPLGDFSDIVRRVEALSPGGEAKSFDVRESDFTYRDFKRGRDLMITAGEFEFSREEGPKIDARIDEAKARRATQPLDLPNTGSVFKNPDRDFAGRLIEAAGLKGHRVGGAEISDRHANFIVNRGKANVSDALALIALAQAEVRKRFRIDLELEVHVIGEDA